jgi:hypothetical protein
MALASPFWHRRPGHSCRKFRVRLSWVPPKAAIELNSRKSGHRASEKLPRNEPTKKLVEIIGVGQFDKTLAEIRTNRGRLTITL